MIGKIRFALLGALAEHGIERAMSEVTLVLFTTFGPSGAIAFILIALLAVFGSLEERDRTVLGRYLAVPIVLALAGLMASATHLGNPSNALYVLTGVGRSPLSNEVASGVLFFALAAVTWFFFFSARDRMVVTKALVVISSIAGIVFVQQVAVAYSVDTIVTWKSPFVPLNQWLVAVVLGSYVANLTLVWSEAGAQPRFEKLVLVVGSVSFLFSLITLALQDASLAETANSWAAGSELTVAYAVVICLYALMQVMAFVLSAPIAALRGRIPALPFVAFSVSALGVFLVRFFFYVMHMTAGF